MIRDGSGRFGTVRDGSGRFGTVRDAMNFKIEVFGILIYNTLPTMTKSQLSKKEILVAVNIYFKSNNRSPKLKDIPKLPFSKKRVVEIFGTWNKMLLFANLPLNRHPPIFVNCYNCGERFKKQIKEIRKARRDFCSSACNAQFYTTGRKHSEETKAKISASLKAHRIFINQE